VVLDSGFDPSSGQAINYHQRLSVNKLVFTASLLRLSTQTYRVRAKTGRL
jgi:hypothetical protein